jgi:HAMP domain-containing protein
MEDQVGHAGGRLRPPVHVRVLADGHRIIFRFPKPDREGRPAIIGAITLAVLLLLTGATYWLVRRLFLPLNDIRAGAIRFGSGDFSQPIPKRRDDDLGDLASEVNAMAEDIQRMLDAKLSTWRPHAIFTCPYRKAPTGSSARSPNTWPATQLGREAIESWLKEAQRASIAEAIQAYAEHAAGTAADLDEALENASIEYLGSTEGGSMEGGSTEGRED